MTHFRFAAMILTSIVAVLMTTCLNTCALDHVLGQTHGLMALMTRAVMAAVMLASMLSMYSRKTVNIAIFAGIVDVFTASLWLVGTQKNVEDVSCMIAMIPRHRSLS